MYRDVWVRVRVCVTWSGRDVWVRVRVCVTWLGRDVWVCVTWSGRDVWVRVRMCVTWSGRMTSLMRQDADSCLARHVQDLVVHTLHRYSDQYTPGRHVVSAVSGQLKQACTCL
ncbi:hypothetical protein ElyMa_006879500 [Elysia marginata]|uniref:Uncharacterized protein n=1 Tax=Elysia marginata TaxID=1093978 RepID=A0AAV4JFB3_9GAST|nr:hypothetical protein ElyMa_006879500 [Elysia marginata]